MSTPTAVPSPRPRSRMCSFEDVAVGARFRFPWWFSPTFRVYVKTGEGSYGTALGEPGWPFPAEVLASRAVFLMGDADVFMEVLE